MKKWFTTPMIVAWITLVIVIVAIYFILANQITPYSKAAKTDGSSIRALMEENTFRHLQVGDKSFVITAVEPGKLFHGSVKSIANATDSASSLHAADGPWFTPHTTFLISVDVSPNTFPSGGTADVVILKANSPVWNALAYAVMGIRTVWNYL